MKAASGVPVANMASVASVTEWLTPHYGYSVHYSEKLLDVHTAFQHLEVLRTPDFGNVMRLDGALQCSEHDEFFYHEPLVHVPAMTHSAPRSALVIGGGDGGAAEELLKHPGIEEVTLVEIDAQVVAAAQCHLRTVNGGIFDRPSASGGRFAWSIGDGFAFVRDTSRKFDLIVLDLTDPGGPSSLLYTAAFYAACRDRLNQGGILSLHVAAPWAQCAKAVHILGQLRLAFAHVVPYMASVPLSGGAWLMAYCSASPLEAVDVARIRARHAQLRGAPLQYYSVDLHPACQVLPAYLAQILARN
jgi:spermidine synthase